MLAILTKLFKYISSLMIALRWFQDILFGLGYKQIVALGNSGFKFLS